MGVQVCLVVFLPMKTAGILGSITGIGELLG